MKEYRSYIRKTIDDIQDSIDDFYQNQYLPLLDRSTVFANSLPYYTKNEDGLYVLERLNGEDSIKFENIMNLSALESFNGNEYNLPVYVIDFCSGSVFSNKKSLMVFDRDTPLKILDIPFNLLSKFVSKIELPQSCFDLVDIVSSENVLDLSNLKGVDFTEFIVSDTELTLFGVVGIKNKCTKSKFDTLNLTTVTSFDNSTEPYFQDCEIKSLAISNTTLIKSKSKLCVGCKIDELLIYDNKDIDIYSRDVLDYRKTMEEQEICCFEGCTINKVTIVSNVLLSHTFKTCYINDLELSPRDNENGLVLDSMAVSYSSFNSKQHLNVSKLGLKAFYVCVINQAKGQNYKSLELYVKDIPDEESVSNAMGGFEECCGNYEVLDCTSDGVKDTILFDENGLLNDDVVYNTLYALLNRGNPHFITLPKEFK